MRFNLSAALLPLAIVLASTNAFPAEPRNPDLSPVPALVCASGGLRPANLEFRAAGLEPAWTLESDGGRCVTFAVHGADVLVSAELPEAIGLLKTGGALYGVRTQSHDLQIAIERRNCAGDASGGATTHTVTIRLDGTEYLGCGGTP